MKPKVIRCAFGRHADEPVLARRSRPYYVLVRCTRCGRDLAMLGDSAKAWIERHMEAE